MATQTSAPDHVQELTPQEGWKLLDERARQYLDMGADEFLRAWDEGRFEDTTDPRVFGVAILLPFVR